MKRGFVLLSAAVTTLLGASTAMVLLWCTVGIVHAQSGGGYLINKSTIAGGGGEVNGGGYVLNVTVGEHDAGHLTGDGYVLTGGFLPSTAAGPELPIPTVSEWGLVVLTLLLLIGAKIYFGRRQTPTA